jgi:hypothetical protein
MVVDEDQPMHDARRGDSFFRVAWMKMKCELCNESLFRFLLSKESSARSALLLEGMVSANKEGFISRFVSVTSCKKSKQAWIVSLTCSSVVDYWGHRPFPCSYCLGSADEQLREITQLEQKSNSHLPITDRMFYRSTSQVSI